jgi:hypothetical protein
MKKSNWQVVRVCFETKLGLWKRLMTSIGRLVSKEVRGTPPEKRFWAPDVEFSQNWYIIDPIYIYYVMYIYIYKHTQSYIYICIQQVWHYWARDIRDIRDMTGRVPGCWPIPVDICWYHMQQVWRFLWYWNILAWWFLCYWTILNHIEP